MITIDGLPMDDFTFICYIGLAICIGVIIGIQVMYYYLNQILKKEGII